MSDTFPAQSDEPMSGDTTAPLYNLVYCSRASASVDDAVVAGIVKTAQRQNPLHGITGLLVFGSGMFFQWLEGPRTSVQQLLDNIKSDGRHSDVVQLSESEEQRDRLFPDWSMELVSADHIRDVLADALDSATDEQSAQALGAMLENLDSGALSAIGHA